MSNGVVSEISLALAEKLDNENEVEFWPDLCRLYMSEA